VSFWSRGRPDKESAEAPSADAPTTIHLAVVEFWAENRRTLVGMDLSQERLTDLVNRQDTLSVVLLDEQPEDRSKSIEMRPGRQWTQLPIADSLLILPPPQATNPLRRLHRPKQPVEVVIGPFLVSGMVHVPPGTQAAAFLIRQNVRFAPVTRATVRDGGLAGFEQRADVVLVNMRRVETIRDIGIDEPEPLSSPDPPSPMP
jgi:hypothetical protein